MDRVEYTADGNRIGISVKRPKGLRTKWSEAYAELACEACGSTHVSADKSGLLLVITCHNCINHWRGNYDRVLDTTNREEAAVNLWPTSFEES